MISFDDCRDILSEVINEMWEDLCKDEVICG